VDIVAEDSASPAQVLFKHKFAEIKAGDFAIAFVLDLTLK
jgi:hypothetical protein